MKTKCSKLADEIIKQAYNDKYIDNLNYILKIVNRLKSNASPTRMSVQSLFNLVKLYLERAESQLSI